MGGFLWRVVRTAFAPDGRQIAEVKLPCANVTKLAFGGDALKTAYVTTARHGWDRRPQPLAGGLFAFEVDVPGLSQSVARRIRSVVAPED